MILTCPATIAKPYLGPFLAPSSAIQKPENSPSPSPVLRDLGDPD